ncbi:MarR family winged helix-turn-helix transcriptional regulator [Limnobacter sp.]|uniref:MarR family winged helix-turn-helix transcriptional regulator n=1 Tax=Limnobacter sp. TaxID=2003368 RepID=UPI00351587EC
MDRRLFFMLNRARAALHRHVDNQAEQLIGVPVAQISLLFALAKQPRASMQTLGATLGLNSSAMTGLVQRMQNSGLLERVPSEEDARVAHLRLTPTGEQKLAQAKPLLTKLNKQLQAGFTAEEIDTVLRFLNTVHTRFAQPHGDHE